MTDLSRRTAYGRVARLYDWCARVGSLGAIPLVKKLHLLALKPESTILYVGGGTCEEAIIAASHGHRVTILDSSDEMLQIACARAQTAGVDLRVSLLHRDFFSFNSTSRFDAVALHFFLDIFDPSTVRDVLSKSTELLAPDGRIFVADFAHPNGTMTVRWAQWCYHQGGALACGLLAGQPWLQIDDYEAACTSSGLIVECTKHVGLRWFGRSWYIFLSAVPQRESPK